MSHTKQHNWNTEELVIAYYGAKYDFSGLNISEYDLATYIIDTSLASLKKQMANFRYMLGLEGYKLDGGCSEKKIKIVDMLDGWTISQIRKRVNEYIDKCDEKKELAEKKEVNHKAYKKRDELNAELNKNFESKLARMMKYRRLRKVS